MNIPKEILEILTKEEAERLVRFYGTDFYSAYLRKLKEKYYKLHNLTKDIIQDYE